ncbi:MAG TPA: hypothetical protein VJW94_09260 [Candidatus Acidoferrum sp.]|nr:hypothetical protein [Candidatus Acidoferrum sp.]
MRTFPTLLLSLASFTPAICHAQTKCPWLNEATASGILSGRVTVTVKLNDQGTGMCKFNRQQGAAIHELRISVDLMTDVRKQFPAYLAQCPPKSPPLPATGNEAVTCTTHTKENHYAEIVVGRVRNQAFVVSLSSTVQDDPSMTQKDRRDKANQIAEQVTGILF